MSAREIIAHAAWRHEATSGAPTSVANARTLEAFADSGPLVRVKWLSSADAILAAMPDMIAPLVWEVDKYGRGFIARSVAGTYGSWDEGSPRWYPPTQGEARYRGARSLEEAQAAANAHHRAAIMAAFNGEAKP
jgi:hypothetical protein